MQVVVPRSEWLENPIGLTARRPQLTWELASDRRGTMQAAYQLRVGSAPATGDGWDTGRVDSADILVEYAGPPLGSRTRCWWQVRVWDERDEPTSGRLPRRG